MSTTDNNGHRQSPDGAAAAGASGGQEVDLLSQYHQGNGRTVRAREHSSCSSPASTIEVDIEKGGQHKQKYLVHQQKSESGGQLDRQQSSRGDEVVHRNSSPAALRQSSMNDQDQGMFYSGPSGGEATTDNNNNDHVINQNEQANEQLRKDSNNKSGEETPNSICDTTGPGGYVQSPQGGCISDFVRSMWYNQGAPHGHEMNGTGDHHLHHQHHQHHHQHHQLHQGAFQDPGSDQVVVSNGMELQLSNSISYASHSCQSNGNLILPPPPLPPNVARPVTIIRSTSDSMGVVGAGLETMEHNGSERGGEGYETKEFFKKYDSLSKPETESKLARRRAKKKKNETVVVTLMEGEKEWISTDLNRDVVLLREPVEKKFKTQEDGVADDAEKKKRCGKVTVENGIGEEEVDAEGQDKRKYRKYANGGGEGGLGMDVDGKHSVVDASNGIGTSIALLTEFAPFVQGQGEAGGTTLQMYSPSHGPTATTGFIASSHELYSPFQAYDHGAHLLSVDPGSGRVVAEGGQEMIIPTNLCLYPTTTTAATMIKASGKQGQLHRLTAGGFLINNNNNCDSESEDFLMNLEHQQRRTAAHTTDICILDSNGE